MNTPVPNHTGRSSERGMVVVYVAIMLFVLEEFFVEPLINLVGEGLGLSILIKLVIVLGLKMSEGFIEKRVMKKEAFREAIKDII